MDAGLSCEVALGDSLLARQKAKGRREVSFDAGKRQLGWVGYAFKLDDCEARRIDTPCFHRLHMTSQGQ